MTLCNVFPVENIFMDMKSTTKNSAFEELLQKLSSLYPNLDYDQVLQVLKTRESKMTTGIIHGVAVPHACVPCLKDGEVCAAIGVSKGGIEYDAFDGAPVNIMFIILSSQEGTQQHLQILKNLAVVLQSPGICQEILSCDKKEDIYNTIKAFESRVK